MNGLKRMKLGLAAIAAGAFLAVGGLLLAGQVGAISGTLSVSDGSAAPGQQATVELSSNVGGVGLGAWTVDVSYDPSQVSVVSCSPEQGGVCNPAFADDAVRITGASASGLVGNKTLGSITFECANSEGDSPLGLSVEVFADATIGSPADISETTSEGTLSCAEPAAATNTPASVATATPVPGVPNTGSGGTSGNDFSWLIASLAAVGVAALAGYSLLRVRTRSW